MKKGLTEAEACCIIDDVLGVVAQLVERHVDIVEVVGSSPIDPTKLSRS